MEMAGAAGFEPANDGVKVRCVTASPRPCIGFSAVSRKSGIVFPYTGEERKIGTPEGTRTPGLLLRRQLLYPTELLAHIRAAGSRQSLKQSRHTEKEKETKKENKMERVKGIEPSYPAWKAGVLPLNYTRKPKDITIFRGICQVFFSSVSDRAARYAAAASGGILFFSAAQRRSCFKLIHQFTSRRVADGTDRFRQ